MTTALQQLLAELDAAPAVPELRPIDEMLDSLLVQMHAQREWGPHNLGRQLHELTMCVVDIRDRLRRVCRLDDVRRWVRTLAMEMMQMRAPIGGDEGGDALLAHYHAARDAAIRAAAERDKLREQAADDNAEIAMLTDEWRIARSERDAARAEVERLTKERAELFANGTPAAERMWCPHYGDCNTCKDVVANTRAEFGQVEDECDKLRTEVERLTRERDRAQDGLLAVSQERNRIERETVEAIAAWLYAESSRLVSNAHTREANDRNQRSSALANAADSLRAGTWKEPRS